ncbi:SIS domain-containing protein [Vulcanisaeta souniana]|uniref:Bifunctional phosphoglucose/phosphomannose isomerase n=1 Tax=Vulcanisaeta souniana JCM 11219 TaxID=1293586 RepID=A0A830ELL7_9CREN|nr:SIS domain-containing protein [Vulcanisaeta souniana]BDR93045.1 bifunctional phosphoglucose/phosphomannose isomerase [Vulcanisaeta souniana JCM 11219]GGI83307.1 bifunctional phosphoglucose/phosphomannose isomerase [Vulcanisaeta souniana JCM 11219]
MNLIDYPRWPSLARESILNVPMDLRSIRLSIDGKVIDYSGDIDSVIITGMGGSGVVGDIINDLCLFWDCRVPIIVSKNMRLPRRLSRPLVIAISYSGNTAETIMSANEALARGYPVIGITTGGRLSTALSAKGVPVILTPKASAPRYGLPALLYPALIILERFSVVSVTNELESGISGIENALKHVDDAVNLARQLVNSVPVVWVTESRRGVGIRFKNDLNENAKYYSVVSVVPEGAHNDIAAVITKQNGLKHVAIMGPNDYEGRYEEVLIDVISSFGAKPIIVKLEGKMPLELEMYGATYLGITTLALAELLGVEPVSTEPIDRLKNLLNERKVFQV